jgi:hypothetical protein
MSVRGGQSSERGDVVLVLKLDPQLHRLDILSKGAACDEVFERCHAFVRLSDVIRESRVGFFLFRGQVDLDISDSALVSDCSEFEFWQVNAVGQKFQHASI